MIRRDHEFSSTQELEPPCHYIFDLPANSSSGNESPLSNLQVDSPDKIPPGALNIRPIREGDIIRIDTVPAADGDFWPVREIHSHEAPALPVMGGFETVATITKSFDLLEGEEWSENHPNYPGAHDIPRR